MCVVRRLLALAIVVALIATPIVAEARAGATYGSSGSSFSSMGSRGSRTWSTTPDAAPMQRSLTPSNPTSSSSWNQPSYAPQAGYGYGSRGGFWSGFGGGLFGAWIGSMLFGHSAYAYDGYGGHSGGFLGTLVMLAIFFFIGRAIWRSLDGMGSFGGLARPAYYRSGQPGAGAFGGGYAPVAAQPVSLAQSDLDSFANILVSVQQAWSSGDLAGLSRLATPEMVSYFSEQLSSYASRRVANRVRQVTLLRGDARESWSERGVQYATALLEWSAIDYTESLDHPGRIVEGDPRNPATVEEFWTFRRAPGGRWLLSAIQQHR